MVIVELLLVMLIIIRRNRNTGVEHVLVLCHACQQDEVDRKLEKMSIRSSCIGVDRNGR